MKSVFRPLFLAALLVTGGASAFAQSSTEGGGCASARPGHWQGPPDARMEKYVAKHLGELKTKLQITTAQEAAWTTFTSALKPDAARVHTAPPDRTELTRLTTPERIDRLHALHAEHMAAMTAEMTRREDATKALYAALNPAQQKIFDAEHARMLEHHRSMRERVHTFLHGDKAPAAPAAASATKP